MCRFLFVRFWSQLFLSPLLLFSLSPISLPLSPPLPRSITDPANLCRDRAGVQAWRRRSEHWCVGGGFGPGMSIFFTALYVIGKLYWSRSGAKAWEQILASIGTRRRRWREESGAKSFVICSAVTRFDHGSPVEIWPSISWQPSAIGSGRIIRWHPADRRQGSRSLAASLRSFRLSTCDINLLIRYQSNSDSVWLLRKREK